MVDLGVSGRPVTVLKVGFVVAVCAAFVGDVWLAGDTFASPSARTLAGLVMLSVFGVAAVFRAEWLLAASVGAGVSSIVASAAYGADDGRFTVFVDMVVLSAVVFLLLVRGDVSARLVALFVAFAGLTVGMRQANRPIQLILVVAMVIGLAAATMGAAYLRSIERERRASVALARQAERLDLAREIHDVVGHHVTGIIVLAQGRRFSGGPDRTSAGGELDATLLEIEAAGHATMQSVRRLVGTLRDDGPGATATWADVEHLVAELRSSFPGIDLAVDDEVLDPAASEAVAVTLRVIREAVTNVRRHGATDGVVRCSIRRNRAGIAILVENEIASAGRVEGRGEGRGAGRGEGRGEGFGLIGMRERVEALGGTFRAGAVDPGRWRLTATIPPTRVVRR